MPPLGRSGAPGSPPRSVPHLHETKTQTTETKKGRWVKVSLLEIGTRDTAGYHASPNLHMPLSILTSEACPLLSVPMYLLGGHLFAVRRGVASEPLHLL